MMRLTLTLTLREILAPPAGELQVLDLGLQDTAGEVHAAAPAPDGVLRFVAEVDVVDKNGRRDFRGALVHGRPGERFLYLSWKRRVPEPTPWAMRVKIPLAGLAALGTTADAALTADITGRRPHDTRPIDWRAA